MRVVEEKIMAPEIMPAESCHQAIKGRTIEEPVVEGGQTRRQAGKRRRRGLARFLFAASFMFAVIVASLGYLIVFIAGPLVRTVDALPADFPSELAIYELDQARVKVQSAESKERLAQLLKGLPEWSLEPFRRYLTTDLKTRIAAGLKDPNLLPQNLSLGDLSDIPADNGDLTKTVSLEWNGISKSKEELLEYYKNQLAANGFAVNEKLEDYEIDLSFFKPGVSGAMTIADSFMKDGDSVIRMTVDYLETANIN